MKKIYSFLLLILFIASCSEDKWLVEENKDPIVDNYIGDPDGQFLDVFVEDADIFTRDIQFSSNAEVLVNSIWLGVFDIGNGNLVSDYSTELGFTALRSGEPTGSRFRPNFSELKAGKSSTGDAFKGYFIVAVVNYSDVLGRWNNDPNQTEYIIDMLRKVDTWEKFNSIGVDTKSAYEDEHSYDSPMMAGFVNSSSSYDYETPSSSHIKINQFASGAVNLLPETLINGSSLLSQLRVDYNTSTKKFGLTGKYLFLRRLVANINVSITSKNSNIEITGVSYKKYNVPRDVYIIERSMLDNTGSFPTTAALSPNFADLHPGQGYQNDEDWYQDNVNHNEGNWTFSFQHFANKHWARKELNSYSDREKLISQNWDGEYQVFDALSNGNNDFNNYASYFKLKVRLLDKTNNRCAEAIYTIHEGYCSDEDGYGGDGYNPATKDKNPNKWPNYVPNKSSFYSLDDWNKKIYQDFSCARNVNYHYNIEINGFDNLNVNVNYVNGESVHYDDQAGRVWDFYYVGDASKKGMDPEKKFGFDLSTGFYNFLSYEGDEYIGEVKIDNVNPDLAFRIYGFNSKTEAIEGYNFNFTTESFSYLSGIWPGSVGPTSHYYQDYNALVEDYIKSHKSVEVLPDYSSYENEEDAEAAAKAANEYLQREDVTSSIETLLFETFKLRDNAKQAKITKIDDGPQPTEPITITDYSSTPVQSWSVLVPVEIDLTEYANVVDFIRAVHYWKQNSPANYPTTYDLQISKREYEVTGSDHSQMEYVRCFYLANRNGKADSKDGCTHRIDITAAIQGIKIP